MSPNQYVSDLRAEVDRLRAKVARVEELADDLAEPVVRPAILLPDWDMGRQAGEDEERHRIAQRLRTALGSTDSEPAATERQGEAEGRHAACVARWSEAETGAYDPRCCRFPKSCSATITTEERTDGV